jgi:hypothetical protein
LTLVRQEQSDLARLAEPKIRQPIPPWYTASRQIGIRPFSDWLHALAGRHLLQELAQKGNPSWAAAAQLTALRPPQNFLRVQVGITVAKKPERKKA